MRSDLNKQLCERERSGSTRSFKQRRRSKKFNTFGEEGENLPSQESMKFRHGYDDRKSFSENLSPLYGIVRKSVGRRWDSFYSELCRNFNMRSVINKHILQHLEDYCERNVIVKNGVLYVAMSGAYSRDTPLSEAKSEFYVDPRDGIIKRNKHYTTYKQDDREYKAEAAKRALEVERWIDADNVLRLIDGTWFHFTMEDLPLSHFVYEKPPGSNEFKVPYGYSKEIRTWEQLDEHQREHFGRKVLIGSSRRDVFLNENVNSSDRYHPKKRYHATKQTASHKLLKQAGVIK